MIRQKSNILNIALCVLLAFCIASCKSSKKVQKDPANNQATITTTKPKPVKELSPTEKLLLNVDSSNVNYTAKVKVNLAMNNKAVSTSGSLKMRWNDVIQISLVDPILGITEIGRLEFSKDDVLVVDRINKQYVRETYDSLASLAKTDLSYDYIQALFWAESQKKNNDDITYKLPLKQPITLSLKLSGVGHKDGWDTHTSISSKYKKVTAQELFSSLSNLK